MSNMKKEIDKLRSRVQDLGSSPELSAVATTLEALEKDAEQGLTPDEILNRLRAAELKLNAISRERDTASDLLLKSFLSENPRNIALKQNDAAMLSHYAESGADFASVNSVLSSLHARGGEVKSETIDRLVDRNLLNLSEISALRSDLSPLSLERYLDASETSPEYCEDYSAERALVTSLKSQSANSQAMRERISGVLDAYHNKVASDFSLIMAELSRSPDIETASALSNVDFSPGNLHALINVFYDLSSQKSLAGTQLRHRMRSCARNAGKLLKAQRLFDEESFVSSADSYDLLEKTLKILGTIQLGHTDKFETIAVYDNRNEDLSLIGNTERALNIAHTSAPRIVARDLPPYALSAEAKRIMNTMPEMHYHRSVREEMGFAEAPLFKKKDISSVLKNNKSKKLLDALYALSNIDSAGKQVEKIKKRGSAFFGQKKAQLNKILSGEFGNLEELTRAEESNDDNVEDQEQKALERSLESEGMTLPAEVKDVIAPFLNFDITGIKLFVGDLAGAAVNAFGAEAFTLGKNIFFGRDKFDPDTPEGLGLLAHEMLHTSHYHSGESTSVKEKQAEALEERVRSSLVRSEKDDGPLTNDNKRNQDLLFNIHRIADDHYEQIAEMVEEMMLYSMDKEKVRKGM